MRDESDKSDRPAKTCPRHLAVHGAASRMLTIENIPAQTLGKPSSGDWTVNEHITQWPTLQLQHETQENKISWISSPGCKDQKAGAVLTL